MFLIFEQDIICDSFVFPIEDLHVYYFWFWKREG